MMSTSTTMAPNASNVVMSCNGTTAQHCGGSTVTETNFFYDAGVFINTYYLWVIFAIGFPANMATILVICRMRNLGSFMFYVALLAVTDSLTMIVKITYNQLLYNQVNIGTAGCRLLQYAGNTLMIYCNWLLVLMAVERLIAVRYPFRIHFQTCLTRQKAAIASLILSGVFGTLTLPILWLSVFKDSSEDLGSKPRCVPYDHSLINVVSWIVMLMYAFIPFFVIVFCNIFIAREIHLSFRLRSACRNHSGDFSESVINQNYTPARSTSSEITTQRQIMLMLFAATFMFLTLHFPICAFYVAEYLKENQEDIKAYSIRYFCQQLAYVLCDSNYALNFFFYFLSAKKFRLHFRRLFTTSFCKRPVPL